MLTWSAVKRVWSTGRTANSVMAELNSRQVTLFNTVIDELRSKHRVLNSEVEVE